MAKMIETLTKSMQEKGVQIILLVCVGNMRIIGMYSLDPNSVNNKNYI